MNRPTVLPEGKRSKSWNIYAFFAAAYCSLYLVPFIYLLATGELSNGDNQTELHFYAAVSYFGMYLLGGLFSVYWIAVLGDPTRQPRPIHTSSDLPENHTLQQRTRKLADLFGWIGVVAVAIYYVSGGYRKLFLLGADVDPWAYRMIGYDDTNRLLSAGLEVARRILLPFAIVVRFTMRRSNYARQSSSLATFVIAGVLAAIVNLDRGPIFLYLTLALFVTISERRSGLIARGVLVLGFLGLVGIIGSVVTYLQYNITSLSFPEMASSFSGVLLDRVVLDPVRMANQLVFSNPEFNSEHLMLRYSRLSVFWGGTYVGTETNDSVYVTPVGVIADVWRNFGMYGVLIVAFVHGIAFQRVSRTLRTCDRSIGMAVSFLSIVLVLYLFYSGIFSQGPVALFVIIVGLTYYGKKRSVSEA